MEQAVSTHPRVPLGNASLVTWRTSKRVRASPMDRRLAAISSSTTSHPICATSGSRSTAETSASRRRVHPRSSVRSAGREAPESLLVCSRCIRHLSRGRIRIRWRSNVRTGPSGRSRPPGSGQEALSPGRTTPCLRKPRGQVTSREPRPWIGESGMERPRELLRVSHHRPGLPPPLGRGPTIP